MDFDDLLIGKSKDDSDVDESIIELTEIVEQGHVSGDDDIIELTELVEDDLSKEIQAHELGSIDAALERVIEKKFGEKIEGLLYEAVERVVKKEIETLKKALFDENS